MATVRHYDKRTGTTYVYESRGYYDREAHKTKHRRRLIGKLNENGEVVPTGKRGRPRKNPEPDNPDQDSAYYKNLYETCRKECLEKDMRISELEDQLELERTSRVKCEATLKRITSLGKKYLDGLGK